MIVETLWCWLPSLHISRSTQKWDRRKAHNLLIFFFTPLHVSSQAKMLHFEFKCYSLKILTFVLWHEAYHEGSLLIDPPSKKLQQWLQMAVQKDLKVNQILEQDKWLQPSSVETLMFCMNQRISYAHHPLTLKITRKIQRIA